jgi:hypothetical protein
MALIGFSFPNGSNCFGFTAIGSGGGNGGIDSLRYRYTVC